MTTIKCEKLYIGTNSENQQIHIEIHLKDGKLSISGQEGNCHCGQINMCLSPDDITPAKAWNSAQISLLFSIWDRWHLNNLRAGSPKQEAFLRNLSESGQGWTYVKDGFASHFDWAISVLKAANLQPDNSFLTKDGQPYSYGSAWLTEQIPQSIINSLLSLPGIEAIK